MRNITENITLVSSQLHELKTHVDTEFKRVQLFMGKINHDFMEDLNGQRGNI